MTRRAEAEARKNSEECHRRQEPASPGPAAPRRAQRRTPSGRLLKNGRRSRPRGRRRDERVVHLLRGNARGDFHLGIRRRRCGAQARRARRVRPLPRLPRSARAPTLRRKSARRASGGAAALSRGKPARRLRRAPNFPLDVELHLRVVRRLNLEMLGYVAGLGGEVGRILQREDGPLHAALAASVTENIGRGVALHRLQVARLAGRPPAPHLPLRRRSGRALGVRALRGFLVRSFGWRSGGARQSRRRGRSKRRRPLRRARRRRLGCAARRRRRASGDRRSSRPSRSGALEVLASARRRRRPGALAMLRACALLRLRALLSPRGGVRCQLCLHEVFLRCEKLLRQRSITRRGNNAPHHGVVRCAAALLCAPHCGVVRCSVARCAAPGGALALSGPLHYWVPLRGAPIAPLVHLVAVDKFELRRAPASRRWRRSRGWRRCCRCCRGGPQLPGVRGMRGALPGIRGLRGARGAFPRARGLRRGGGARLGSRAVELGAALRNRRSRRSG